MLKLMYIPYWVARLRIDDLKTCARSLLIVKIRVGETLDDIPMIGPSACE